MFGVRSVECHDKYLGLPTFAGKCKQELFSFIKNRVWNKVKGWISSLFSQAKETLIKAKQGWRLIHFPNSLVGKVLKACYFPNCSFLEAKIGGSPSYTWRSIWWGREIIELGSQWRVGSGDLIRVTEDRWILKTNSFKILDSPPFPEDFCVSKLCTPSGPWDVVFIRQIFGDEVANDILSIPVINNWWKSLWQLKIPPKSKNFTWRLCKGWLPLASKLHGRGMDIDTSCFCCGFGRESVFHSIWICLVARKYWKATCFYGLVVPEDEKDILSSLLRIQGLLSMRDFCLFLTYI
ncbi:hypothetical protein UlMin_043397 [Ulmus minor]